MAHDHGHHGEGDPVYFQYEDIDQQQESYLVGMWAFIVTEIMFFGALFLLYTIYRIKWHEDFYHAHYELNWMLGGLNTVVLLFSSFTVALAVHFAQKKKIKAQQICLGLTIVCACMFMVIKTKEYSDKFYHNKFPDRNFEWKGGHSDEKAKTVAQLGNGVTATWQMTGGATSTALPAQRLAAAGAEGKDHSHEVSKPPFLAALDSIFAWAKPFPEEVKSKKAKEASPERARLFLSMYFAMTGLHGLHVVIGIGVFAGLMIMIARKSSLITDYIPTEMVGLYWHFVDLVWIFLFPLFYLIPQ